MSFRVGQMQRGLAEEIAPALTGADVGVAEPQAPVERGAVAGSLDPQPCRYDSGVAQDPHGLSTRVFFLMLVHKALVPSLLQLLLAGVNSAIAENQDHVLVQDASYGLCIIRFDRRLEFRI